MKFQPSTEKKRVSFCITCKDRIEFLKETLPKNLRDNRADQKDVEFVLMDFASEDGLQDWVLANFREELDAGYLNYFYTERMPTFHMAIAKNTAHAFAQGKIVTNLDGDNFTGQRGGRFVYRVFEKHDFNTLLHQFSGTWRDGTCGRVSALRDDFWAVSGYNEKFHPGYDDIDLIARICANKEIEKTSGITNRFQRYFFKRFYKNVSHPRFNRAIRSPDLVPPAEWKEIGKRNRKISGQDIANKRFVANGGKFGLTAEMCKYTDGKLIPCQPTCPHGLK